MLRLPVLAEKKELKPNDLAKLDATLGKIDALDAQPDEPAAEQPPKPDAVAVPSPPTTPAITYGPVVQFDSDDDDEPKDAVEAWLEKRIKEKIGEDGTKGQLFLETMRSHIPTMMLACVPLFAFVLKLLYVRQRRYYVEHLVYALHIHTFLYVAVVVITLIGMAALRLLPTVQPLFVFVLSAVAAVQVFLSIRRVYRQGWFMTTFKFLLGASVYLTVIVMALGATAFITLLLP